MPETLTTKNEKAVSGKTVADHIGVDVHTVRRWRYSGMPAVVYNRKLIRYYLSEVEEWLRTRKK
jgi:predicted site-specific integrase-resolvase